MTFSNPQTALVFDWIDATLEMNAFYNERIQNEDFSTCLKQEAEKVWSKLQPSFGKLSMIFYPIHWDEIASAFTERYRVLWQTREEEPFDISDADFI